MLLVPLERVARHEHHVAVAALGQLLPLDLAVLPRLRGRDARRLVRILDRVDQVLLVGGQRLRVRGQRRGLDALLAELALAVLPVVVGEVVAVGVAQAELVGEHVLRPRALELGDTAHLRLRERLVAGFPRPCLEAGAGEVRARRAAAPQPPVLDHAADAIRRRVQPQVGVVVDAIGLHVGLDLVVRERLDRAVRAPDQVALHLGADVAGGELRLLAGVLE